MPSVLELFTSSLILISPLLFNFRCGENQLEEILMKFLHRFNMKSLIHLKSTTIDVFSWQPVRWFENTEFFSLHERSASKILSRTMKEMATMKLPQRMHLSFYIEHLRLCELRQFVVIQSFRSPQHENSFATCSKIIIKLGWCWNCVIMSMSAQSSASPRHSSTW